jgi:hypothetical protein
MEYPLLDAQIPADFRDFVTPMTPLFGVPYEGRVAIPVHVLTELKGVYS